MIKAVEAVRMKEMGYNLTSKTHVPRETLEDYVKKQEKSAQDQV
jgi:hypothetical protein